MSNSISEAFKKLNVANHVDLTEHEQIYTVSYEYLSKIKHFHDLKAFQNCFIALINLDKYFKAFELIKKLPNEFVESLLLEIGYIYYKLGKSDDLISLYEKYNSIENQAIKLGMNHILAQNYYKIGKYQAALELYFQLIKDNQYDNQFDLIINERAVISQINFNDSKNLSSKHPVQYNNYDLLLNESLIELSKNNYSQSLSLLNKADEVCNQDNINSSPQDLLLELLPIKLTQAYIYQLQGQVESALEILSHYDLQQVNDDMLKLIIKNNLYSINISNDNINTVERDLSYQQHLAKLSQKLTKYQYQIITKNNILLKFTTGTLNRIDNKFIENYLRDFPGDLFPIVYRVLLALEIDLQDITDNTQIRPVTRKLVKFVNQQLVSENNKVDSNNDLLVALLLLVFVNEKADNFAQSLPLLKQQVEVNLEQDKLIPVLVGTLINVYEKKKDSSKAKDLIQSIVEKVLKTDRQVISQDLNYYNFIKVVGFKSLNYNINQTNDLFQFLHEINPEDDVLSAILNKETDKLLSIDQLTDSVADIEELLATNVEDLIPTVVKQSNKPRKVVSKVNKKKATPKFGKSKVMKPKEELDLDDERWLPLKLRSYYKPSKKDKKKLGGHQGALEGTPVPSSAGSASASSTSSSKNKKKKKGKK